MFDEKLIDKINTTIKIGCVNMYEKLPQQLLLVGDATGRFGHQTAGGKLEYQSTYERD